MTPSIFVILLNWNNAADTIDCLDSLNSNHYSNFKTVLIDNNSEDTSKEQFQKWIITHSLPVQFIPLQRNLGFAAGNNVGIKYALEQQADYILLLNNDTVVPNNFLEMLIKSAAGKRDLGVLGCRINFSDSNKIWFNGGTVNFFTGAGYHLIAPKSQSFVSDFITGCVMLIPAPVLKKVGGFDERFFLTWEDTDLSFRIKRLGYRLIVDPGIVIAHKVSRSIGTRYSPKAQYYFHRNRMIFFNKILPNYLKIPFFIVQLVVMIPGWILLQIGCGRIRILIPSLKGYIDFLKGITGQGSI